MSEMLEKGSVYFLYRPRVQHEEVHGIEDIQRLYIVLKPQDRRVWRLLTVGRKRLPGIGAQGGERLWAFVEKVVGEPRHIEDDIERRTYDTKTRGQRVQPEARPAGEGIYAIVRHGDHTHWAYELEFPKRRGPVQRDLAIEDQASYIVVVRNPNAPANAAAGVGEPLASDPRGLPEPLAARFRGRRFAELSPEFLDRAGTELIFIGASTAPEQELDVAFEPAAEHAAGAAIFDELKLERERRALEPLFKGEWR